MLTKLSLVVFILHYSVVVSRQCSFENPKRGELHPSVKLEVITKQTYPQNNDLHVTVRCTATAPVLPLPLIALYNPRSLQPNVIKFFVNNKPVPVNNCPPSSGSNQKTCELVVPNFKPEDAGKYYCQARNVYGCTVIGTSIPVNSSVQVAPCVKEKEALNLYEHRLIKTVKCLKDYTLCCITGSNCNQKYQNCLQKA